MHGYDVRFASIPAAHLKLLPPRGAVMNVLIVYGTTEGQTRKMVMSTALMRAWHLMEID